jgi:hypothetical protein
MSMTDSTDDLIRRAIGDGTNLPNAGKKLDLDDPYTPDELKIAHKFLKDNDLAPSWINEGKGLDADREQLVRRIAAAVRANSTPQTLNADIAAFNKRILSFNLKAPQGISHKRMLDFERERVRLTGG